MSPDPGTIVLVEDNFTDAEIARRAIERMTPVRNLVVVEDGYRAVELLLGAPGQEPFPSPRLLLIDVNLPGLDGIELLARLRGDPRLRHVSAVMVSSSLEERDIRRSYDVGCNGYVTKPLNIRSLYSMYANVASYWTQTNIPCPGPVE